MHSAFVTLVPVAKGSSLRAWRCSDRVSCAKSVRFVRTGSHAKFRGNFLSQIRGSANYNDEDDDDDDDDDGGDGYFGRMQDIKRALGIPLPEMNAEERRYVDAAANDAERMRRLKEIAVRRYEELRDRVNATRRESGSGFAQNASEDYIESLTQKRRNAAQELSTSDTASSAGTEADVVNPLEIKNLQRRGMNAGQLYMDNLAQKRALENMSARSGSEDTISRRSKPTRSASDRGPDLSGHKYQSSSTNSHSSAIENQTSQKWDLDALEKEVNDSIQRMSNASGTARNSPPSTNDTQTASPNNANEPELLDRQISFLEAYLEKLKVEDSAAKEHISLSDTPDPVHPVMNISPEDLISEFDDSGAVEHGSDSSEVGVDRQKPLREFPDDFQPGDPLATRLPEKRGETGRAIGDAGWGDGPAEMTEDEIDAQFEKIRKQSAELRSQRANLVAPVTPPDKKEKASRLAAIALRIEYSQFIEKARKQLDEFESKVREIFERYTPDLN